MLPVFFTLSLIVFINIGGSEIQPWDEGLYAMRAQSILLGDDALDQTDTAIGGLYSSTNPPLAVWGMAFFMKIAGSNPLGVRFFSALCSCAAVGLFYLIAQRFLENDYAVAAAPALIATAVWNMYSRQGMLDIPLITFCLLALFTIIKCLESQRTAHKAAFAALFGIALAAALMTKIVLSLLPLFFLGILFFQKEKIFERNMLLIASIGGIALAAPWYISMAAKHGWEFVSALFLPHLYSAVENNTRQLGILYYFNQLLISNPLFLMSLLLSFLLFFKKIRVKIYANESDTFLLNLFSIWFIAGFTLFTIAPTKMPHYPVYLVPPAILLALKGFERGDVLFKSYKQQLALIVALVATLLFGFSFGLRQSIKEMLAFRSVDFELIGLILVFIFAFFVLLNIRHDSIIRAIRITFRNIWIAILIVISVKTIVSNLSPPKSASTGAVHTAALLEKSGYNSFVYLYHEYNPGDSINPQLAWYTRGWTANWRAYKSFVPVALRPGKFDVKNLYKTEQYDNIPLVYYVTGDWEVAQKIVEELAETRNIIDFTKNYYIFGRRINKNKTGGYI